MTYLAMEMVLYLVSAALIGTCLGWVVWGGSHRRKITKIHKDMTAAIEAERSIASEARRELKNADTKLKEQLDAEKAKSEQAVIEARQLLETERQATETARADLNRLRLDMEGAVNTEKATASTAIHEAMQYAEDLKVAAREAEERENQIRTELEELRLMAGAEKLASQSARGELDRVKMTMQSSLEAERETSAQAWIALDDIRAALVRTFGEGAAVVANSGDHGEQPPLGVKEATGLSEIIEMPAPRQLQGNLLDETDDVDRNGTLSEVEMPIAGPAVAVDPGLSFDIHDQAAPSSEKPPEEGASLDARRSTSILENPDAFGSADEQAPDHTIEPVHPASSPALTAGKDDEPADIDGATRPPSFYHRRPDDVDELQAIDGIDPTIETHLNEHGCYQFRQLAQFSKDDIDWLSRAAVDVPDLKERIERDDWIEQARELEDRKYMTSNGERPRWWNRRRLQ